MDKQVPLRLVVRLFVVSVVGVGLMFVAYRSMMSPDTKLSASVDCPTPSGFLFPPDCGAVTPVPCHTPPGYLFPTNCPADAGEIGPQTKTNANAQPVVPVTGPASGAVGAVVAPAPGTCTTSAGAVFAVPISGTDP